MTEETRTTDGRGTATDTTRRTTLGEVSHTNPHTDESFGDAMVYHRGPTVAADGGTDPEREGVEADGDADAGEDDRLKDIEHTPPDGDGANRVHERGGEVSEE